ncbi:MAG: hypothetical protein AAGB97_04560 [Dehalococcoidia bacterium]|nr:hypothetical protein [Chloroflexota bacterium]MBT9159265.1 hypothetical protein [Chloroflexota bacterium]MBT9161916.1 hypothetical protein [Chloroflexota bacterium]
MQKIGLLLILVGVATIVGYQIYAFVEWVAPLLPWPLRVAIAAPGVGGILILASLIRERIKGSKEEREKFKGVDR